MNARGFTLIELLVAVTILALMAALAYGGLNGLIRQYHQSERQVERMAELQRTLTLLGNDLLQVRARPVREPYHGDRVGALVADPADDGGFALEDEEWYALKLTRGGWSNPGQQRRATLQRVGWRLRENRVERAHWQVLDRAQEQLPVVTPLVDEVESLRWRFLDAQQAWHEQWPPADVAGTATSAPLPRALELVLLLENGDEIRRLFVLP